MTPLHGPFLVYDAARMSSARALPGSALSFAVHAWMRRSQSALRR